MRGGFPLVFSSDGVLVAREERRTIRVHMARFEDYAGPGRSSVMAAVAVSGGHLPLMGRFGVQMAPYRILLTLLNLRVGTWVRNPLHARAIDPTSLRGPRPGGLALADEQAGSRPIATEAAGASSANRRWVYLSDGGHLDNTGLVECVRHCVCLGRGGRIVVLDASNDPPETWSAVGDAIAVIRADLDIDLQRRPVVPEDVDAPPPPWARRYVGGGLEVLVVKAVRVSAPAPDAAAGTVDWTAPLPPNVQSFQLTHKDFPRASTARQKFGDLEFEAYRGLGYAATRAALLSAGWVSPDP